MGDAAAERGPHGGEHSQAPGGRPPQQLIVLATVQHQQLQPVVARGFKEVLHLWPQVGQDQVRWGRSPARAGSSCVPAWRDRLDQPSPPCSWPSYTCIPWPPGGASRAPQTCSPRSWARPSPSESSACGARGGSIGITRAFASITPSPFPHTTSPGPKISLGNMQRPPCAGLKPPGSGFQPSNLAEETARGTLENALN